MLWLTQPLTFPSPHHFHIPLAGSRFKTMLCILCIGLLIERAKRRNGKWRDQSSVLCRCSGKILLSVFSSAVSWLTQYLSTHNKCRYKRILLIKRSNKISNSDVSQVAIYGAGAAFRSRSVSGLKLMLAEGHVLGQVITMSWKVVPLKYRHQLLNSMATCSVG